MKYSFTSLLFIISVFFVPVTTSAAIVFVTVEGVSSFRPPQGEAYPTDVLGNGNFIAHYSYDDSVTINPTTLLYENAVKSFSLNFDGGSTFVAIGGDLKVDSSQFSIRSLVGEEFPDLAGMSYSDFILFKFKSIRSEDRPNDDLPTAAELKTDYVRWFTWIEYDGNPNSFVLTHRSVTIVPEPTISMLGVAGLSLIFRRQRSRNNIF